MEAYSSVESGSTLRSFPESWSTASASHSHLLHGGSEPYSNQNDLFQRRLHHTEVIKMKKSIFINESLFSDDMLRYDVWHHIQLNKTRKRITGKQQRCEQIETRRRLAVTHFTLSVLYWVENPNGQNIPRHTVFTQPLSLCFYINTLIIIGDLSGFIKWDQIQWMNWASWSSEVMNRLVRKEELEMSRCRRKGKGKDTAAEL